MSRRDTVRARWCLILLLCGTMACLTIALRKDPAFPKMSGIVGVKGDFELFRKVVTRVQDGDSFYDATQDALRRHGYPSRSVFNWRTPCYAWLLGRLTGLEHGRWLLVALTMPTLILFGHDLLADCGIVAGSVAWLYLVGSMAFCLFRDFIPLTEPWAAAFIMLSLAAFRRGWAVPDVGLGLLSIFYRELAVPYAVVSLSLAARRNRKGEAMAWGLGLVSFALFMTWHGSIVQGRLTNADRAMEGGWIHFGGVEFLLATTRMNCCLLLMPSWAPAIFLPVACLGLAGMSGEFGRKVGVTGLVYLVAFSLVGNPFNYYWGIMIGPILALGIGYAPAVLLKLLRVAFSVDFDQAREPVPIVLGREPFEVEPP